MYKHHDQINDWLRDIYFSIECSPKHLICSRHRTYLIWCETCCRTGSVAQRGYTWANTVHRVGCTNNRRLPVLGLKSEKHYTDVTMSPMASQITSPGVVYSTVYSGADQRKHQSSVSLTFVRRIHRGPMNSPHKRPVTRKMFPFDDAIMNSPPLDTRHAYEQIALHPDNRKYVTINTSREL